MIIWLFQSLSINSNCIVVCAVASIEYRIYGTSALVLKREKCIYYELEVIQYIKPVLRAIILQ